MDGATGQHSGHVTTAVLKPGPDFVWTKTIERNVRIQLQPFYLDGVWMNTKHSVQLLSAMVRFAFRLLVANHPKIIDHQFHY